MKASLPEVNQFTGNCFHVVRIVLKTAYSGTLTRREIVRANASLGKLRRDKEKLSSPISYEFVRDKASLGKLRRDKEKLSSPISYEFVRDKAS